MHLCMIRFVDKTSAMEGRSQDKEAWEIEDGVWKHEYFPHLAILRRRAPTLKINAPHIAILVDLGKGLRVLLGQVHYGLVCIHLLVIIGVQVELERCCLSKHPCGRTPSLI